MVAVAINVNDPEADALTRKFAHMAGVAISEAIVIATKEAIASAKNPMTSPIAVLEAARGLARPDKFDLSVEAVESLLLEFMDERGIEICDLPPAGNNPSSACGGASLSL
nr:type II toxin-antitoxin system VapB family antitoxin [Rhizobium sp. SG741]